MTVNLYKEPQKYSTEQYLDFIARNTAMIVDLLEIIKDKLDAIEKKDQK